MINLNNIFEVAMLVLFGISWPVSIYKSYKTRVVGSKSIIFLFAVILGYISGIINKIINGIDYAIIFYGVNACMVSIDACLYFRNKRLESKNGNK